MKCPHCLQHFHEAEEETMLGFDQDGSWSVFHCKCPACNRLIARLVERGVSSGFGGEDEAMDVKTLTFIRPKGALRPPPPPEVPKHIASDFIEACLVLADSPKASAALSRRCLQHLLRDGAKVKPNNLSNEIQQVLDSGKLPTELAESIDAIRNTGNFAAHPMKSTATGEIVDVAPGEAEWNLDVLEELFDFYFVRPAALKKKRDALNKKLSTAGKAAMK